MGLVPQCGACQLVGKGAEKAIDLSELLPDHVLPFLRTRDDLQRKLLGRHQCSTLVGINAIIHYNAFWGRNIE